LILAILFGLHGFYRGFIHQVFFILAVFAGIYGGMYASVFVGKIFSPFTDSADAQRLLGFALSFVLITVIVVLIGGVVRRGFWLLALGLFDHLLGAVFGVASAALLTAFGVFVLKALLPADSTFVRESAFAPHAQELASKMLALVPESLQKRFEE